MKRSMDLCRAILLHLEESDSSSAPQCISVVGVSEDEVSYHVKLLADAGLIEALDFSDLSSSQWSPICLTWEGHEFLDAARDDTIWNKAKAQAGDVPIQVLKELLIHTVRNAVGL